MDLLTRFEGAFLTVGPSNGPTATEHGVAEVPGGGQGPSSGPSFALWLGEMANAGAQRAGFAPWLWETADVGAQRVGFAPTSVKICQLYREMVG